MVFWYLTAVIGGILFGAVFYYLLQTLIPSGTAKKYWSGVLKNIQLMLTGEESRFWTYYGRVISTTGRYVGRQLIGFLSAVIPLVIFMIFVWPNLEAIQDKEKDLTIFPKHLGEIVLEAQIIESRSSNLKANENYKKQINPEIAFNNGSREQLPHAYGKFVLFQKGGFWGNVLLLFGFSAIYIDQSTLENTDTAIVRADLNNWNPLWPYLSDWEFLFFISFSVLSIGLMIGKKIQRKDETDDRYSIGGIDLFLTWISSNFSGIMRSLGDKESWFFRKKIFKKEIRSPIFVTGLARAGTTILLETLSKAEGLVSHRYRDFPFIMTPVFWNLFLSVFSKSQSPIERPHKDGIKITRDSPDAFEEPIWQHFFPYLHDRNAVHRLTGEIKNDGFKDFYKDHIKKILMIRKGSRYLSKGNYNISRIEYLAEIFEDAKFIIPIRHPLDHIQSLLRQHQIFLRYSKQDAEVPEYLKSVGHYEFGPQREPICLTSDGCQLIIEAWEAGENHLGYAHQWGQLYGFVLDLLRENQEITDRIKVVRFEDLCDAPHIVMQEILDFVEIDNTDSLFQATDKIKQPSSRIKLSSVQIAGCWEIVKDVAAFYGYKKDLNEKDPFKV